MSYLEIIVTSTSLAVISYVVAAFVRNRFFGTSVYSTPREDAYWQFISETASRKRREELDFAKWDAELTQDYRETK